MKNWNLEWINKGAKIESFNQKLDFPSVGEEFVIYKDKAADVNYMWDNKILDFLIINYDKNNNQLKENLKDLFLSGDIKIVNEVSHSWTTVDLITSVYIDDQKVYKHEVELKSK